MADCPCGSGKDYNECCGPLISGAVQASTAEALMRSRYTAYVKNEIGYIVETHNPDRRHRLDEKETEKWARESEWKGLEIVRTEKGGPEDSEGVVEFIARFKSEGTDYDHHEVSNFVRKDGRWYFDDGFTPSATYVREQPKVGRNDPCPCGSGKKYKRCCGK